MFQPDNQPSVRFVGQNGLDGANFRITWPRVHRKWDYLIYVYSKLDSGNLIKGQQRSRVPIGLVAIPQGFDEHEKSIHPDRTRQ